MAKKKIQIIKLNTRRDNDPSLTLTLRNTLGSNFSGRFKKLSAKIRTKIVQDNFFKATASLPGAIGTNTFTTNGYSYPSSSKKIQEFMIWLNLMIDMGIFEKTLIFGSTGFSSATQHLWIDTYIQTAYRKGLTMSQADLKTMGFSAALPENAFNFSAYLSMPVHIDALNTLYIRAYESLKGITAEMSGQISQILAQGIAEGQAPLTLARQIANRIDKIGITRAKRLARTEIIRAHATSTLINYELLSGIIDEEILVQWWTALDERVRSRHRAWHGDVLTVEEARKRIGEPNCRCSQIPYLESINSGEDLDIPYPGWIQTKPTYE